MKLKRLSREEAELLGGKKLRDGSRMESVDERILDLTNSLARVEGKIRQLTDNLLGQRMELAELQGAIQSMSRVYRHICEQDPIPLVFADRS